MVLRRSRGHTDVSGFHNVPLFRYGTLRHCTCSSADALGTGWPHVRRLSQAFDALCLKTIREISPRSAELLATNLQRPPMVSGRLMEGRIMEGSSQSSSFGGLTLGNTVVAEDDVVQNGNGDTNNPSTSDFPMLETPSQGALFDFESLITADFSSFTGGGGQDGGGLPPIVSPGALNQGAPQQTWPFGYAEPRGSGNPTYSNEADMQELLAIMGLAPSFPSSSGVAEQMP